jgi:amino acid transporter
VSKLSTAARRLLIGQPFRSDRLSHTLLPKRIALPVFAFGALSSVAYAPEEIFPMLSVAGLAAYSLTPWIGLAVAAVMLVVVASYRQNVHAYPSGGGDYEVVTTNRGETAGLTVVVGHWWEQVLHNQSVLRLKGRLLFMPGVMVTSVPWQLNSSERVNTFQPHAAPGDARRGIFD